MYARQVRGPARRAASTASSSRPSATSTSSGAALAGRPRAAATCPIIAQMTVGTDGKTHYGTDPVVFGPELAAMGADVIGVNCSVGPHGVLEAVEKLARVVSRPDLGAAQRRPPARGGRPQDLHGVARVHGQLRPAHGRGRRPVRRRLLRHDARPHPRHRGVRAERVAPARVRRRARSRRRTGRGDRAGAARRALAARVPSWRRAGSSPRWRSCRPRGWTRRRCSSRCRQLKAAGVDAVNVPDGPRAQSRMGALLSALMIEREVGLEAVVHYACRDRNLLGMLSDLLGAAAAGVRNLLIITGDPPKMGPYPEATAVFDIDSIGLTNLVSRLNHGLDPGGNPIGAADPVRDRRRGESGRARLRARAQALRLEGGGRRGVRHHPAGVRSGPARPVPQAGRERSASRSSPASGRWSRSGTRSSWPTRCPA